ncbi:MAG TPA: sigma 54-interacting transcriptional regulator [Pyrinomonadaceae bacterium]|jgi:transcriptional regulator with GAF, ATPase, and Fis domain/predicted negative regulator of RcsB-dependent stress response
MTQIPVNQAIFTDALIRAQKANERGDLTGAQKLLLELIAEGKDAPGSERDVQARTLLAEIYEGLGQYDGADEALAPYDVRALDDLAPHLRGLLLVAFGSRAYWQNDFPRSVTLLNRALECLEPTGDATSLARVYHCLGRTYWALDEQPLAREHYEIAIEWGRRSHRDRALAITYMNLGLVARHEGDLDEAGMCYRRALRLLRHTADEINRARLQNNLGVMLLYQGNFYEAANASRRALEHLTGSQNGLLLGMVYNNLAIVALYMGEWAVAESRLQQALGIARSSGDRLTEGTYTETLGQLRTHQGRVSEANELLRFALARAVEMGSKKDETQALLSLAKLWLMSRNMHLSLTYARNARDLAREINDERLASEAALLMIEGYRRSDKWMPAEDWASVAQSELEHLPYPYLDTILQRNLASFISRRRDPSKGERLFQQTEEAFRSMNAAYQVAVTIFEHGESLVRRGEYPAAHERFTEAARQFHSFGAQVDGERAESEAQRAAERMAAWQIPPAPSINLIPPDVAPLITQILSASSGRERLLRELMFAAKSALAADSAAIFAADDDGQLYAQATIDLDEQGRERAAKAVSDHLAAKEREAGATPSESSALGLSSSAPRGALDEHCRTLAPRRNGGAFVLYLHAPSPLSDRRREILDALTGCARLALQMIDLRTDMKRARPFNAMALPSASGLFPNIIATSFVMRDVLSRMERLKDSDATVLVLGESGTGKEVIARALHEESGRRDKVFLPFNCTAAPRELVESQLFGHRRGTFTGAVNDQRGIIRAAEGGTLFLDEIGDLSLEVQPKLLRFLQGGEIMPLGEAPQKVNVRVIAATNRDLELDVREGRFREDLFYRLNTFVIKVPPLRERPEDIPLLVSYYFEETCRRNNRQLAGITPEAMSYLVRYQWPGNVRQLRSEIERIVVFAEDGQSVGAESLSSDILRAAAQQSPVRFHLDFSKPIDFKEIMLEVERQLLTEALARYSGNMTRAAGLLGLSRQTLNYKLRRFDVAHRISDDPSDKEH